MSFSLLVIIFAAVLWYVKLKKKNPDEAEKIERQVKDVMSGIEDAVNGIGKPVQTNTSSHKLEDDSIHGYTKPASEDVIYLNGEPVDLNGKPLKGAGRKSNAKKK